MFQAQNRTPPALHGNPGFKVSTLLSIKNPVPGWAGRTAKYCPQSVHTTNRADKEKNSLKVQEVFWKEAGLLPRRLVATPFLYGRGLKASVPTRNMPYVLGDGSRA